MPTAVCKVYFVDTLPFLFFPLFCVVFNYLYVVSFEEETKCSRINKIRKITLDSILK